MTRKFLGDSDQATLSLQLLLIGLSANDNLMGPTMGLRLADWQQGRECYSTAAVEFSLHKITSICDNKFMHSFIT